MRNHRVAGRASLSALCTLVACGDDGGDGWAGTLTDSAGIEIVANAASGMWGQNPPVLEEDLRIGTVEGDANYEFGSVAGIDVDHYGRIYVLDNQAFGVRVFDAQGIYVRDIGRQGSGPGELGFGVGVFAVANDTLLVVDVAHERITLFQSDGTALQSTPLDLADGIPLRWDRAADGRLVTQMRTVTVDPAFGEVRDLLVVRGSVGGVRDTLIELPAAETSGTWDRPEIRMFAKEPKWAMLTGRRFATAMNDAYRIGLYSSDGTLERIVTKPFTRQPVTEDDRARIIEALTRLPETADMPVEITPQMVEIFGSMIRIGDFYPAFAGLMGGPHGTLWVQHVRTAASLRENEGTLEPAEVGSYWAGFSLGPPRPDWDVFDAEGRFLGTMRLPDRFNPLRVHDGAIYGVQRDELDVQYVVRLRIIGIPPRGLLPRTFARARTPRRLLRGLSAPGLLPAHVDLPSRSCHACAASRVGR